MQELGISLYMSVISGASRMKSFVVNEVKRVRDDESGMELLQVILIILLVVVIAAVLWAFLGDWIQEMLRRIFGATPDPGVDDIERPTW
jgi:peptidoglycan/LPS O-acetylase OafA/YrhL